MKRCILGLAAFALLFCGLAPVRAGTLYTDKAAFLAATTGLTTIDFNGIAPKNSYVYYGAGPLTLSGVTFTGNGSMYIIDPGLYGSPYKGGGYLNSDYSTTNIVASGLPSGVTAVGADFGSLFSGGATFTVTDSAGDSFTVSTKGSVAEADDLGFFGITSAVPLTSLTFSMPDFPNYNAIDNFVFGTAVVPEPATLTLLGIGIAGMAGYGWRRRKMAAG